MSNKESLDIFLIFGIAFLMGLIIWASGIWFMASGGNLLIWVVFSVIFMIILSILTTKLRRNLGFRD